MVKIMIAENYIHRNNKIFVSLNYVLKLNKFWLVGRLFLTLWVPMDNLVLAWLRLCETYFREQVKQQYLMTRARLIKRQGGVSATNTTWRSM